LSNVWGDASDTVELQCEGKAIGSITRNLDAAFRHVRLPNRHRYLWVDAVCISQLNIAQRGHQVGLMRSIYKNARQVLIWVGEDHPYRIDSHNARYNSDLGETTKAIHAFEIINHICDLINLRYALAVEDKEDRRKARDKTGNIVRVGSYHDRDARRRIYQTIVGFKKTWDVVEEFFSTSWFGRQWIIQEMVVATSSTMFWGDREIAWPKVGEIAYWMKKHHPPSRRHLIAGAYNASYTYSLSMEARHAKRLHHMSTVVASAWSCQVSDPRDKINAMLGLPNLNSDPDQGNLSLKPDYTLSREELYANFTRRVIAKEKTLRFFNVDRHDPEVRLGEPSWVPQ
jgi:hypothetical protein